MNFLQKIGLLLLFIPTALFAETFEQEYIVSKGPVSSVSDTVVDTLLLKTSNYNGHILVKNLLSASPDIDPYNWCGQILANNADLVSCEPNRRISPNFTPNDTFFQYQTSLDSSAEFYNISAPFAWDFEIGSPDVVVAVLDTGVDYLHPDIIDNLWVNPNEIIENGIDDDNNGVIDDIHGIDTVGVGLSNGYPYDFDGHGTAVAGIIGATGNNNLGIAGVSWGSKILPVKFMDNNGGTLFDEIEAINYIIDLKNSRGVNIVALNASYSSTSYSAAEFDAFTNLKNAGILVVAAAGNYDTPLNTPGVRFPANYNLDNIISVAALDEVGALASFSNSSSIFSHIAAPGENILSLKAGTIDYDYFNGTSMAAPHVTGTAALIASMLPDATAQEIRELIFSNTPTSIGLFGKINAGRYLNVGVVIEAIQPIPTPIPSPSPTPTPIVNQLKLNVLNRKGKEITAIRSGRRVFVKIERDNSFPQTQSPAFGNLDVTVNDISCNRDGVIRVRNDRPFIIHGSFDGIRGKTVVQFTAKTNESVPVSAQLIGFPRSIFPEGQQIRTARYIRGMCRRIYGWRELRSNQDDD